MIYIVYRSFNSTAAERAAAVFRLKLNANMLTANYQASNLLASVLKTFDPLLDDPGSDL